MVVLGGNWGRMDSLTSAALNYLRIVEALAIVVAVLTAVSSADDVFVDLYYWCLRVIGGQDAKDRVLARDVGKAARLRERPFAIMVPAWAEHDVIHAMVATKIRGCSPTAITTTSSASTRTTRRPSTRRGERSAIAPMCTSLSCPATARPVRPTAST